MNPMIEIRGLELGYISARQIPKHFGPMNLSIFPAEALGLIGESGAGKSSLGLELLGLLTWKGGKKTGGSVLSRLQDDEIAYIPQDPLASLDPLFSIGNQLKELSNDAGKIRNALRRAHLSLDNISLSSYPHELSGGMRQRLVIAMALLKSPKLIIADEPTSSLDVILASQIIRLFREIRTGGISFLFITHNLALAASFCDRIAVMKNGEIVETATPRQLFEAPVHPYTITLVQSLPEFSYE